MMTNADRIRKMSNEDLCSFLVGWQISTLDDAHNGIAPDRLNCMEFLRMSSDKEVDNNGQ